MTDIAAPRSVWLIERGQKEFHTPTIWYAGESKHPEDARYGGRWTENANRAVKFTTQEECEATVYDEFTRYWGDKRVNCHASEHVFLDREPATPAASAPRGEDALLDRLTGLMVGGCTCMTKTPELAHHDPQCKYRVASEAYDTIAAQAREIAELRHDIERAQEASTALATELEAARAGAPQSSAEHFQREGILPDIIREALDAYDDFMGDDDYRGMAVLREIMDRMRKRFTPFDAAREAKP